MTLQVHNTIRLDVDLDGDGLPVNQYKVIQDGYEDVYSPAVAAERSLTGRLHVHRLRDDSNDPMVFVGARYSLFLTRAEKDELLGDLGKDVYFMPHYRDEDDATSHRTIVLLEAVEQLKPIDPMLAYWAAAILLTDSASNTPS